MFLKLLGIYQDQEIATITLTCFYIVVEWGYNRHTVFIEKSAYNIFPRFR